MNIPILNNDHQQAYATRPFRRRVSRQVMVGNVPVGGNAAISVQTMTKTKTSDIGIKLIFIHFLREFHHSNVA